MSKLRWLKRLTRSFSDIEVIKTLFNIYVKPSLLFASPIWSPNTKSDINKLESVIYVFLRYIAWKRGTPMSFLNHCYHDISISENIYTICSHYSYYDAVYAYKIKNNYISSPTISSYLSPNIDAPTTSITINSKYHPPQPLTAPSFQGTRGKKPIFQKYIRTNYLFCSVIPRLIRTWNSLPSEIRELDSISKFKNATRVICLKNYDVKLS